MHRVRLSPPASQAATSSTVRCWRIQHQPVGRVTEIEFADPLGDLPQTPRRTASTLRKAKLFGPNRVEELCATAHPHAAEASVFDSPGDLLHRTLGGSGTLALRQPRVAELAVGARLDLPRELGGAGVRLAAQFRAAASSVEQRLIAEGHHRGRREHEVSISGVRIEDSIVHRADDQQRPEWTCGSRASAHRLRGNARAVPPERDPRVRCARGVRGFTGVMAADHYQPWTPTPGPGIPSFGTSSPPSARRRPATSARE